MTAGRPAENVHTGSPRLFAFFPEREDAYRAVTELKAANFSSDEIGLIGRSEGGGDNVSRTNVSETAKRDEGFWDKLKNFFSGDSSEDIGYRDSTSEMNWDQRRADYYYRGIGRGGALVSVAGPRIEEARRILQNAGGDLRESGFESATGTPEPKDDYRFQLRGEVLRTFRERVQRGEVRLRKEVVTENKTVEVPVTREELVVERVPVSGQETSSSGEIGSTEEIRVPLTEERTRVEKQPVVQEEVRIGKRAVQNTEAVATDVRHEELRVDKEGDVEVNTPDTRKGKKPAA